MTKTYEAGSGTGDDGRCFDLFAAHGRIGADDAQCAGGRYTQAVHGFGTQKLADGAAQDRPAVAHA